MKEVTVCLTSCNRFDLLCRTIDTFRKFNTYPIKKFYITEDSGVVSMKEKIEARYGDSVTLLFHSSKKGQVASIDEMYSLVDTDYIFHLEDDYTFYRSGFIEDSIKVLENCENINQVWIRGNMLTESQSEHYLEKEILSVDGVKYKMVISPNSGYWCGFSFNAGIRRRSDYTKIFPNGFTPYHNVEEPYLSEVACNKVAMDNGYRACQLMVGYCDTAGYEDSSYKEDWKL